MEYTNDVLGIAKNLNFIVYDNSYYYVLTYSEVSDVVKMGRNKQNIDLSVFSSPLNREEALSFLNNAKTHPLRIPMSPDVDSSYWDSFEIIVSMDVDNLAD